MVDVLNIFQKCFKLFLNKKRDPIVFDALFVQLPIKEDSILEEKDCKKYALMALSSSCFEVNLILLTKVVPFHIQVFIVQVRVFCIEKSILSVSLRFSKLWRSGIALVRHKCLCKMAKQAMLKWYNGS